jgi:hypothetical protein
MGDYDSLSPSSIALSGLGDNIEVRFFSTFTPLAPFVSLLFLRDLFPH